MFKRLLSETLLVLLLTGILTLTLNIRNAKSTWTGTVYIRADGSIDPPDAPITTYDNITYTLTDNITSSDDGIVVEKDNVIIEGAGYKVQGYATLWGPKVKGIKLVGRTNVTIMNVEIEGFWYGMYFERVSNSSINGNNIASNLIGLSLESSQSNNVYENNITYNGHGIYINSSLGNSINGNNIIGNTIDGVVLSFSLNNTIYENNITYNGQEVVLSSGIRFKSSSYNSICKNNVTANNCDGIYFEDGCSYNNIYRNLIMSNKKRGINLWRNCSYNSINENNVSANSNDGIYLNMSPFNGIFGNIISGNSRGIYIKSWMATFPPAPASEYNFIYENNVTANSDGILIEYSSHNNLVENILINNQRGIVLADRSSNNSIFGNILINDGLYVWGSYDNFVENNTVNAKPLVYLERVSNYIVNDAGQVILVRSINVTVEGLFLTQTTVGVQLLETYNSIICKNNITSNKVAGIMLSSSYNNSIIGNNIENNCDGIQLWYSSNNTIYHNNFLNNSNQVFCYNFFKIVNAWDNGYPDGGNYWSDYSGFDADSDGIGDTSYYIYPDNTDRYPLIAPITVFNAGKWNGVAYNIDIVSNSTVSAFYFNPEEGAFLRFNVTGKNGTAGFCRVTIPKDLLWTEDEWVITVGGLPITNYTLIPDSSENHTYLYFTYNHSIKTVIIQGTHVIPEFPSALIIPLFTMISAIAIVLAEKKTHKKQKPKTLTPIFPSFDFSSDMQFDLLIT